MFESIVSSVLNQVLGNYVDNLDGSQLKLGIFSGNVVLKNLKLKKEAVDKLNLPIEVIEGHLGSLELIIPWANLKTQPVRVLIGDLYVLAGPLSESEYDKDLEEKRIQQVKQEMLETAELFRSSSMSKENSAENDTFVSALVTKIIDNLQVVIKNIHVRFEDNKSHPKNPFALGMTLSNLSAVSTDPNWIEAFIEDSKAPTHKLLKLDSLAVYWTPNSESLLNLTSTEFITKFKSLIHSESNPNVELRYLLKPVTAIGKIIMRKQVQSGEAKNLVNLEFDSFRIKMDDEQYYDVLMLAQNFIISSRNGQYRKYRPSNVSKPVEEPEIWFKYAVTCILEKIKSRNKTRLWINVIKRRQTRKKYVMLFKKKEVDGTLSAEDLTRFKMLEEMLSFEDIKFYRSLARSEMKEEQLIPFALKQQQQAQTQASYNFVSRWWNGNAKAGAIDDSLIKEEDIKKFYETIDYDENSKNQEDEEASPRDSKLLEISFDLKSGSISLAQTNPKAKDRKTILSLQFIDLIAHVIKRPDTLRAEVSLLDFSVIEKLTEFSIFPNLVRAKPSISLVSEATEVANEDDEIARMASTAKEPFLSFIMDEMAENSDADKSISFSMKPLEIVLNHQAAQKIVDFVYGPKAKAALETLASAAETHITALANKTRASLENALEEHKALDLSVDIDAPVIYIPYDCEDPNAFLFIADLGHIEVRSRLVTANEKAEFSKKRRRILSSDELNSLYTLMYDVLNVRLNRIKLSYAESLAQWNQLSSDPEFLPETNRIIDDIDVSVSIATCIVPKAINLAQKKIYAKLPAVQLIFSDEKYKKLMKLIEAISPEKAVEIESSGNELVGESRNKSIFEDESTTRHSLSLSPQAKTSTSAETDDEFYDALENDSASKSQLTTLSNEMAEYEAINIDLLIEIEEICAKLIRENKKYHGKDLLTLVAKKLKIACNVKPFNTVVNLLLEAFFIRDDMNFNGEEEVYLLSGLGGAASDSLLKVNVNLVDEAHPLFTGLYNSANIQVLLELASLNLFLNPATLIQTAEFFDTMFENEKDYEIESENMGIKRSKSLGAGAGAGGGKTMTLSRTASRKSEPKMTNKNEQQQYSGLSKKSKSEKEGKKILLTAKLSELAVLLGIGEDHFADLVLSSALAAVCVEANGDINFSGNIADFVIAHKKGAKNFDFLRIDGENSLEVSYKKIKTDELVKFGTGALHFTFDALFIEDSCDFVAKLAKEAELLEIKKKEKEKKLRKARKARKRLAESFDMEQVTIGLETIAEESGTVPVEESDEIIEEKSKLQFEIDISSPVLDFPHPEGIEKMILSIYLGHIHSSNTFKAACDSHGNPLKSLGTQLIDQFINAKLEAMRIELRSEDEMFKLLDDVSLNVDISMIAKAIDRNYAEIDVEGGIDVVRLKIARKQLQKLLNLINSLQNSLEKALKPLESIKKPPKKQDQDGDEGKKPVKDETAFIVDQYNPMPTAVEVLFNVQSIELVLFEEWEIQPLARFALEDLTTNLIMQKDNSMILEQYITELCASDLRTKVQRKFKEIIISDDNEGEDVKFKFEKTSDGDSIIKVEVNAPKIVVSMDLINSILAVFEGLDTGSKSSKIKEIKAESAIPSDNSKVADFNRKSLLSIESSEITTSEGSPNSIESEIIVTSEPPKTFILAEICHLELYILEDPDSASSEAMQLSVQKLTFAQQTNMSLSIDGVSAGFVNMDQLQGVVQFIDPFDITATVELSTTPSEKVTQVWAIVKPVIIRFSYQDIQFFAKLSEQFSSKKSTEIEECQSVSCNSGSVKSESSGESSNEVSPVLSSLSSDPNVQEQQATKSIIAKMVEQVQVNLEGIRVVFIDDFTNVHIPLIDLAVDRISAEIRDWSSALKVNGILKLHANFFNRMNSHWEPIIEPWSLDLNLLTKLGEREKKMSEIVLSSEKSLEIIASHAFLDSLLSVTGKMAVAKPRAASSYREVAKPYLIRNYTGHVLSLWSDSKYSSGDGQAEIVEIPAGTELPFEFEDWKTFRSATKFKTHRISIHLMESPWESIKNISVDQQGLFVYPLRPKIQSTSHKIVCEVSVVDGVRHVILRSATCFKNNSSFDLEIADIAAERFTDYILIKSGGIGALPINFSAGGAFRIRPADRNYKWSEEKFDLFDLFCGKKTQKKILGFQCDPEDPESSTPFFLDLQAQSDTPEEVIYATASLAERASKNDSIAKFYGLGTIVLSPSLEIENLLPFDFGYRIYDHDSKYDFSGTLTAGGMNPLHGIDIKHVIGLSLEIESQGLKTKQVAVINKGNGSNCDKLVQMSDAHGIEASVFIDYDNSNKFAAKRVKIYSPYVILNQTGFALEFKSSAAFLGSDQVAAGQGGRSTDSAQPLLFSYPESNFVSGKDRIKIQADGSEWSKLLSLDAVGNVTNFDVSKKETGNWYNFALYVHLGSDRFSKVHVVKLSPRFVIANRIPGITLYVQAGDEPVLKLSEGTINFHCNPSNFKSVRISYDGETWTPRFTIGDVGETYLKVFESVGPMGGSDESIKDPPMDLVKVSNILETPILYIAITKEKKWPFKIINKSSVEIKFNQKGCKNDRMLLPGESENFAWDDPSAAQLALSVTVMERQRDYNIRELGQCKPLIYRGPGGEKAFLSVNVEADGPVIVVKFKNYDVKASTGIFRLIRRSQLTEEESEGETESLNNDAISEASSNDFGVKEAKDETLMTFTMKLAGLGVSLVGANLIEFMYIYGKGLEFRIQQSKFFQTFGFKLKWFQIDNCLFDYTHPILMYPAVVQKNEKELDEHPTLNIGIIKSNEGKGVDYYKYFGVLLQEMNIELGEELLEKIILFAQFDSIIPPPSPLLQDSDFSIPPLRNASVDTKLMYYELFQIHPIKLNVSFSRTESSSSSEGISAYNPLGPLLSILSMASGNISDAPLKFNSLLLEHPIVSAGTLKDRVIGHYTQQAIVQVHKILGSIDMLGNPVGLFNTMGEGVTDLFYEPYQGFVSDRPQDIGIGLAKGGFSFMRKTVSGLTGTFSKFTGSLGKGLAAATMDTSFQRNRRTSHARNKPTNAALGVSAGAKSLYQSFASGLTGIVEKPMEGARSSGVGGFFKGVGVGLLGAVTKPLVGALDMTTSITEGVKNTADGDSDEISQIRWPRVIPYDSIITAYGAREAYGQSLLATCIELNLLREKYFAHLEVPEDDCIVFVTTLRIMYVKRRTLYINWQVSFNELLFCRPNFDTILLSVKQGEIRKRLIFCNEQGSQEWFCMKVDECLAIFNEKHRALE